MRLDILIPTSCTAVKTAFFFCSFQTQPEILKKKSASNFYVNLNNCEFELIRINSCIQTLHTRFILVHEKNI